ncbi:zinc finger and BTB domain-containing protein 24-like isoform X2 [Mya arenaria]|uniref:zinc finger and BTB domain-containing protein 24-like isoform X2 n=1 Tax=Mya arenaria TaxID=6604 RepID=UPI0022E2649E|nr:zinc finger and BTB domain-containing protein 24-like isoform X2 [Mya arenaria]
MGEISVRSHCSDLLTQMRCLQSEGRLCDVEILAEDGCIPVHRLVLMCASPFLTDLLIEPVEHLTQFSTIGKDIMQIVVDFIYSGRLQISKKTVDSVISLCELLDLRQAVDACKDYVQNGFTVVENGEKSLKDTSTDKFVNTETIEKGNDVGKDEEEKEPVTKKRRQTTRSKVGTGSTLKTERTLKTRFPQRKSRLKVAKSSEVSDLKLTLTIKKEVNVEDDENGDEQSEEPEHTAAPITKVEIPEGYDSDTDDIDLDSEFEMETEKKTKEKNTKTKLKKKQVTKKKTDSGFLGKRGRKPLPNGEKAKRVYKRREKKPFPCEMCSKVLSSYKRKVFHEFSKHGTPYDTSRYSMTPCQEEGCNYVAANRHNLETHMKSRHGVARPHICEFCGKGFKLPNILRTHLNIHTGAKLWKCEECGEGFNQQSGLDVHIKRHHMGEASWAELCHLCSEKFMLKSELAWHLYKSHDQPLPDNFKVYVCDICGFSTMKKAGLISHQERHAGIKKFICPVCQKGCSTKSELRRHVSFHGEKKYKCHFEGCSFACTDQIGLDKHVWLMHTHKDYKPYACPVCQYRTGVKGNVDKHIRTVHDLIVVTKHTVALKMKFPQFNSGDVITKDGRLVATVAERKALQQGPPMDKHGNPLPNMDSQDEIKSTDNKLNQTKNKRVKYNKNPTADIAICSLQSELSAAVVNLTQSGSANESNRDLTALTNYVYIHGNSVIDSTAQNVSVEAQDLRLQSTNNQSEQQELYNLGNGEMYAPNKFEYTT